jgi:hypothetical protein
LREYVESIGDDEVVFRNYEGKTYRYKQPKIAAKDGCGAPNADIVPIGSATRKPASPKTPRKKRTTSGQ